MSPSSDYRYKNFSSIYLKLKPDFQGLSNLDQDELNEIQTRFDKDNADIKTKQHITLFIIFLCAFLSLTIAMAGIQILSESWASGIFVLKQIFLIHYKQWQLTYALIGFITVPFVYLFILPAISGYKQNGTTYIQSKNPNLRSFRLVQIFALYISVFCSFLLLYFFDMIDDQGAKIIVKVMLTAPVIIISILIITAAYILTFHRLFKFRNKANNRISITYDTLRLLEKINNLDKSNTSAAAQLQDVVWDLLSISYKIKNFLNNIVPYPGDNNLKNDFLRSGIYFENNINIFLTSPKLNSPQVKSSLISYFNNFISGDLDSLPKVEAVPVDYSQRKPNLLHYIKVVLYILTPIIIITLLEKTAIISINSDIHNILNTLYIPFAAMVVLNNSAIFNPEFKGFLMDFIKRKSG